MNACATCKYWQATANNGICRRNPPQITTRVYTLCASTYHGRSEPEVESSTETEWPETNADDWCGEHASK